MGISVTGSTGITITQEVAEQFRAASGNEATFKAGKAANLSNSQIGALFGLSTQ